MITCLQIKIMINITYMKDQIHNNKRLTKNYKKLQVKDYYQGQKKYFYAL